MANKSFFEDVENLSVPEIYVAVDEYTSSEKAEDIIKTANIQTGFVIVHTIYDMQLGYVQQGKLVFAKDDFQYLDGAVQIRIFNDGEELLLKQIGNQWAVRHIVENNKSLVGKTLDYLDDVSPIIGKKIKNSSTPGFVLVGESSRKVEYYLPVKAEDSRYEVALRSYIQKNEETGQSGFGFHRYVSINPLKAYKAGE